MRLWTCAAIAFMLCGTVLLDILTRTTIPMRPLAAHSPGGPSSLSSFTHRTGGQQRKRRATEGFQSIAEELSSMFQSLTEGELQQVIGTLADGRVDLSGPRAVAGRRTKRARKAMKPCSLREAVVSVSELGLGYDSDEMVLFRYCSGRCSTHRRNYDMSLEHMKKMGLLGTGRQERARHSPCCRPTAYEDEVSFLDNKNSYHTIHQVSASECGCV